MVAPYFVGYTANTFMNYDSAGGGGFTNAAFTCIDLAVATASDVVNVTNSQTVPAGGKWCTPCALRTRFWQRQR